MLKNVGRVDRLIRLIAGVVLLVLPYISNMSVFNSAGVTFASLLIGAVLIGTALLNFCPLYRVLGIRT